MQGGRRAELPHCYPSSGTLTCDTLVAERRAALEVVGYLAIYGRWNSAAQYPVFLLQLVRFRFSRQQPVAHPHGTFMVFGRLFLPSCWSFSRMQVPRRG